MRQLKGIGVASGVAFGRAVRLIQSARVIHYTIAPERADLETARLDAAREIARQQLQRIRAQVGRSSGLELAALFDAQLLMLDDPMLITRARDAIRDRHINAEWAVEQAFDDLSAVFEEVEDPYFRERRGDLADLVGRLRMNLRHGSPNPRDLFRDLEGQYVLVADELTPSVAAQLDWDKILGFATDAGSRTYHTAILARSLRVPAVVGLGDVSGTVAAGSTVVIDGEAGEVVVDPTPAYLDSIHARLTSPRRRAAPVGETHGPAVTLDGVSIRLEANIELPDDFDSARAYGASGVGLYRSEFLIAAGAAGVGEDAQFAVYRRLLERMAPDPVTVRTFDLDEDQLESRLDAQEAGGWIDAAEHGRSRFGLRGVRLGLRRRDLLRVQLRALLRAARHGRLRIMFPFVSSVEELREARAAVMAAAAELEARGEGRVRVPVGAMIEVPSAAYTADLLAHEADFFTIGTNDLIQCCLAVDRTDARVSHLYQPLHPAILRLIRHVRRAAVRRGIPVSLCGEMASDPLLLALLVGLGLTEFSMTPAAVPSARRVIADLHAGELRRLAARARRLASAAEIEDYLMTALTRPKKVLSTE